MRLRPGQLTLLLVLYLLSLFLLHHQLQQHPLHLLLVSMCQGFSAREVRDKSQHLLLLLLLSPIGGEGRMIALPNLAVIDGEVMTVDHPMVVRGHLHLPGQGRATNAADAFTSATQYVDLFFLTDDEWLAIRTCCIQWAVLFRSTSVCTRII